MFVTFLNLKPQAQASSSSLKLKPQASSSTLKPHAQASGSSLKLKQHAQALCSSLKLSLNQAGGFRKQLSIDSPVTSPYLLLSGRLGLACCLWPGWQ